MEHSAESKTAVVVLAAGKGKRMAQANGDLPKALTLLRGKSMINYLLESINRAEFDKILTVIVVGHGAEKVRQALGERYVYVVQEEQLGTGHAVRCTATALKEVVDNVLVLYSDNPLVDHATLVRLQKLHQENKTVMTMIVTKVDDFKQWRAPLYDFGRIIRDETGNIIDIRERKDATAAECMVREVNPGLFIFRADWLWGALDQLDNKNVQAEYYLTDLVKVAIRQGEKISSMSIDSRECLGVNTPEHLALVGDLLEA